jgi:hypothetical protein
LRLPTLSGRSKAEDKFLACEAAVVVWPAYLGLAIALCIPVRRGQLCLTTFVVTSLVQEAGYILIQAGQLVSAMQVAGVTGRLLWTLIADRIPVLILIGLISLVASLLTGLFPLPGRPLRCMLFSFASALCRRMERRIPSQDGKA